MNDSGVVAMSLCAGGCGEVMAFGEGPCEHCARLAEHYDARELMVRLERKYAPHAARLRATAKQSAHLGAVERDARHGLFRFLGWKTLAAAANALSANVERVDAESGAAPVAGDAERRSELLAKLPRIQCGVRRMCALPRMELWTADVSLCTVGLVLVWDALRWLGCAAMDSVACFCRRRDLRGRLGVMGMLLGTVLGLAVSCAAWGMR